MKVDPWADRFGCGAEATPAVVNPEVLKARLVTWAAEFIDPQLGISIRLIRFADLDCTKAVAFDWPNDAIPGLPDPDFATFALGCQAHFMTLRDPDPTEIVIFAAKNALGYIYSHGLGDADVMGPKLHLLHLGVCGLSRAAVPALPKRRPLGRGRIVLAAGSALVRNPRIGRSALQRLRLSARTERPNVDRLPAPSPTQDQAWWIILASVTSPAVGKIPGVLLYCTLLAGLGLDPGIRNSVIVNLRPFSKHLENSDGNTVSHLPFTADWSKQSPKEVATDVIARIRLSEPLLRRAVGAIVGAVRPFGGMVAPTTGSPPGEGTPLTTALSHVRVPVDWAAAEPKFCGLQTPTLNALAINVREYSGCAWYTINYQGSALEPDRVATAFHSAADMLGLGVNELSWKRL